ncbi:MAG: FHA domain-containing protein [Leptolyngbyaceae cyanobacterium bins.302]|nr:FHA domain-containing protein [Leptolyngbyaceae cyanobacterium bins.302]
MTRIHLLIVTDDKGRRELSLEAPFYSIGRGPRCDIRLRTQFASRCHATLIQLRNDDDDFNYRIIDGAPKGKPSANGIIVNGRKVLSRDLQHEDEIVFGPKCSAVYYILRNDQSSGGSAFAPSPVYPGSPNSWLPSSEQKESSSGQNA